MCIDILYVSLYILYVYSYLGYYYFSADPFLLNNHPLYIKVPVSFIVADIKQLFH